VFALLFPALQDLLGKIDSSRNRRGVLIDAAGVVEEVEPESALQRVLVVDGENALVVAVVLPQQILVDVRQLLAREGSARFNLLVNCQLKLREHRLSEERAAEALQNLPQIEEALGVALGVFDHVVL